MSGNVTHLKVMKDNTYTKILELHYATKLLYKGDESKVFGHYII